MSLEIFPIFMTLWFTFLLQGPSSAANTTLPAPTTHLGWEKQAGISFQAIHSPGTEPNWKGWVGLPEPDFGGGFDG